MTNEETRRELTDALLARTRGIIGAGDVNRDHLDAVRDELCAIAARTELWQEEDFASPDPDEKQNRFQIAQDAETGSSLYLNVMRPGKKIPPHNHTTWAAIAAVDGAETNTLYDRVDDGSVEGHAELTEREVVDLRPGNALTMMPDDIHSVHIGGTDVIRHLHFYGAPLETLDRRISYDLDANTCKIMGIGVKTKA